MGAIRTSDRSPIQRANAVMSQLHTPPIAASSSPSDLEPLTEPIQASDPLAEWIGERRRDRQTLLMTHIVLGYPSLAANRRMVESMVESGVDLMELQIPFSEPTADGPVILQANARALAAGIRVDACLEFCASVASDFDIPFLAMGYYNPMFRRGVANFVARIGQCGLKGAIIPDLPPEEGGEYLRAMADNRPDPLAPVFIYTPRSSTRRMQTLARHGRGFMYCVARRGVTGADTSFDDELQTYLDRCRAATDLPLALGFGVKSTEDIEYLRGKADIAVVGSETLRLLDREGVDAIGPFIGELARTAHGG